MAYQKTVWTNNSAPAINASNLNKMEQGIEDAQFPEGGTAGQFLKHTAEGPVWDDVPSITENQIRALFEATEEEEE